MIMNKYPLHPEDCRYIRMKRKELNISAENLSERIGKAKSWLSQVERGVFASIRHDDLINLLRVLYESPSSNQNDDLLLKRYITELDDFSIEESSDSFDYFGILDQTNYDSLDLQKEFVIALQNLTNTLQSVFQNTDIKKQQFVMLQALRIQERNLHASMSLTNMLSSVPLFTLLHRHNEKLHDLVAHQITVINGSLLSDIESRIELFNLYGVTSLDDAVNTTVSATKEAIRILLEIISPGGDSDALITKYDTLIGEINYNCQMQHLSSITLHTIDDISTPPLDLVSKHLSALQRLLQELTEIQMKAK